MKKQFSISEANWKLLESRLSTMPKYLDSNFLFPMIDFVLPQDAKWSADQGSDGNWRIRKARATTYDMKASSMANYVGRITTSEGENGNLIMEIRVSLSRFMISFHFLILVFAYNMVFVPFFNPIMFLLMLGFHIGYLLTHLNYAKIFLSAVEAIIKRELALAAKMSLNDGFNLR